MDDLTIPLDPSLTRTLEDIAAREKRSPEDVAAEALSDYLREHQRAAAAIRQGMDDARAGRTTPHAAAMDRLRKAAGTVEPSSGPIRRWMRSPTPSPTSPKIIRERLTSWCRRPARPCRRNLRKIDAEMALHYRL